MSLDELQKLLEKKKAEKAAKAAKSAERQKKRKARKTTTVKTPPISDLTKFEKEKLKVKIGNLKIEFDQDSLQALIEKLWNLDNDKSDIYRELSNKTKKELDKLKKNLNMPIKPDRLFISVRSEAYFQVDKNTRLPYNEFRQNWQKYIGEGKPIIYPFQRKEFVQLLSNRYKSHWVDKNGLRLPESTFQLLYRMEREPRAIERIFEFIDNSWNELLNDSDLSEFLNEIQKFYVKAIKDLLFSSDVKNP